MTDAETIDLIWHFLIEISFDIRDGAVPDDTFLPGILVESGGLVVDRYKLKFPGDILHEAGHLAIVPQAQRLQLNGQVDLDAGPMEPLEAAAIAWSYAAAVHLDLDPRVVFHAGGYLGFSDALLRNFELGVFIGVQPLVDAGLTSAAAYPQMRRWLSKSAN